MVTPSEVTSEEKLLAALGYWGSVLLSLLPALVIYLLKKNESDFVRKHAMLALLLNVVVIFIHVILWVGGTIIGAITFGLGSLLTMALSVIVWLGFVLYVLILGIQTFQGDDPDIPILSDMMRKNLG